MNRERRIVNLSIRPAEHHGPEGYAKAKAEGKSRVYYAEEQKSDNGSSGAVVKVYAKMEGGCTLYINDGSGRKEKPATIRPWLLPNNGEEGKVLDFSKKIVTDGENNTPNKSSNEHIA